MDCAGRKAAILRVLFDYKFLPSGLKLSRWGGFCHPVYFFCPWCVVVWDDWHCTITEKPQQKIRLKMCSKLSDFIRGWLGSTGHLQGSPVPPITTHAAFSCLWFCQSWIFGFRFSMLDVCLRAELLFVVHFPPSKHLSHLSWPDKYLKEVTQSPFSRSGSEQYWGESVNKHCSTEGMKPLAKGQEGSSWKSQESQSNFPSLRTVS